ncbi:MAG: branched-chain amino acid aminotransferase [Saprospiraceae bacterium]|nr:branched-chain amino acid aminotransferase [Saprospiraceae bacterium]
MYQEIKITRSSNSRIDTLDFNHIPFGKVFTDHMFVMDYRDGEWVNPEIVPFGMIPTHPGNLAWHYGQAIFEGMKATLSKAGRPLLFRPELHSVRFNDSARRMCMPEVPEAIFIDALKKLIGLDVAWIPPQEGSALYIRPMMYATDESIGVRQSDTYKFIIMLLPVGPYYDHAVKLKADEFYVRAVQGGVGEAKTAGNYAASLLPAKMARAEGYDQVMWLDAIHHKFVQEVGTMNIFFVIGDDVVTPATDGAILKGITRSSVIQVLSDKGYNVVERPVNIDELLLAYQNGDLKEVFGTGTAAVVSPVCLIGYKDQKIELDTDKFVIAPMIKDLINKVRIQEMEDKFNWLVTVE